MIGLAWKALNLYVMYGAVRSIAKTYRTREVVKTVK